ncbi:unnamed protein product [Fusarium venenatum]|uniref:C2H2-type domain-containing protein n=1 Tax=Fusarium venenatum TaxID=56646 RepID=A0A2L2TII3_9HYPO|nr:uncharacterized protein FVRRES_01743 [Fusarium venenatum]CEI65231.1 unnamed protein product [Fusarium venenatum]
MAELHESQTCPKSSSNKSNLTQHIQNVHKHLKLFQCPHCLQSFSQKSNLNKHVDGVHKYLKPFPCPERDMAFSLKAHLDRHLHLHKYEGLTRPFLYPDCENGYFTQPELDLHCVTHHAENPLRFLCNICGKAFIKKDNRNKHEFRYIHSIKCPVHFCYEFFKTAKEALVHAKDINHCSNLALYLCPLPNCITTVAGRLLHNGHVSPSNTSEFKQAELPRFYRNPLFEVIFKYQQPAGIVTTTSVDSDVDMKDSNHVMEDPDGIDHMAIEYREVYIKEEEDYYDSGDWNTVDRGSEVSILEMNENLWGLRPLLDLIPEPCPEQVAIDLHTAFLKHYDRGSDMACLRLRTRCHKCGSEYSERRFMKWWGSKAPKIDFEPLREKLLRVVTESWTLWCTEYEDQARQPVSQVKRTMQPMRRKVVVLDCEYGFEFAIVDRATNEVLINTLIKQTDIKAVLRLKRFPPAAQGVEKQREKKIFSNANASTLIDVKQVVKSLRRAGITPETVFLVWATNKFDLTVVREFLERGGQNAGILPNNGNCIFTVDYFRHNMKGFGMPLRLANVLELLYPGHGLIGHNHRALPDCRQTMLVLDPFDEFCKPSEVRKSEWKLDILAERFSAAAGQAASVPTKRRRTNSTEQDDTEGSSSPKRTSLSSEV